MSLTASRACGVKGFERPTNGRAVPHSRPDVSRTIQTSCRTSMNSAIAGSVIRAALSMWRESLPNSSSVSLAALYQGARILTSRSLRLRAASSSSRLRATSTSQRARGGEQRLRIDAWRGLDRRDAGVEGRLRLGMRLPHRFGEIARHLEEGLQVGPLLAEVVGGGKDGLV